MAVNEDYLTFVQDQLSEIDAFDTKKMFGGIGFFRDGIMFGMIGGGVLRLRVNETTKAKYESAGMEPLKSKSGKGGMPYYEVPQSILEDQKELAVWANEAFKIAVDAKN